MRSAFTRRNTAVSMTDQSPPSGSVGEKIRGLLLARGMSQRQLAAVLAGTDGGASERQIENTRRQVSSWINDAHAPSPENAARIADALDVPLDWIVDDQPRRSLASALEELADLVDDLSRQAKKEAARSEDAVRVVQSLDCRLGDIEALLGQILEGQMTQAAALEEILKHWNEASGGGRGRGHEEKPN